jgi:hypothetical protein
MSSPISRAVSAAFVTLSVAAVAVTVAILCEYLASVPIIQFLERLRVLGPDWHDGHTAAVALWCVALTLPPAVYLSCGFFRRALRIEEAVDRGEM